MQRALFHDRGGSYQRVWKADPGLSSDATGFLSDDAVDRDLFELGEKTIHGRFVHRLPAV